MIRNDYRRAFIMLRSVMPGYGGHVRLERRTLTGSMYFIITAPQGVGELAAALVGRQNGEYYAAPIGPLTRDRRGQLALAWQFDPRSIEGRPLEAYAWVAVVATGGPCALALTGNVEGSQSLDAQALERVACALFAAAEAPAADIPEPSEATPGEAEPETAPSETAGGGETRGDVRVYTLTRARLRKLAGRSSQDAQPTASQEPTPQAVPEQAAPEAAVPTSDPQSTLPSPEALLTTSDPITAARQLGLDITAPWPGVVEPLRRLFATQPAVDGAPGDGFTYVRTSMPVGSGYEESLVGLKADNGKITAVRHALPARQTPDPPAGMEAYNWMPVDGSNGFWIAEEYVE